MGRRKKDKGLIELTISLCIDFSVLMLRMAAGVIVLFVKAIVAIAHGIILFVQGFAEGVQQETLRKAICDDFQAFSPQDLLTNKSTFFGAGDFAGIYIIQNISDDMFYVGQSIHVLSRLTQHFTGQGNGDVYADYKYGKQFVFRAIPLAGSGYANLDELERTAIAAYGAYERGYNKTQGNN